MAGSIGSVYYDVEPELDGFAAKVAAGLGQAKPIKVKVEPDTGSIRTTTAATRRAATQQTAIMQRAAAQQAAIRTRGEVQSQLLTQRTTAPAAAAHARQTAAAQAAAARQTAIAERAAQQQAAVRARAVATNERLAARQVAVAERAATREAASAARGVERASAARQAAIASTSRGLTVAGAGIGLVLGAAAVTTAKFEKEVSNVASTSPEAARQIGILRAEAIKYGADTAFSATESAQAQAELIKANVSVADTINGGLKGALDLAAAGSLEVGDAAGIMATAMSQFKIPGTEASHVADLLAAAAGKAQGEVSDFAGALKYVGPNAKAAGIPIEETVGVLAQFADQGIKGEQAGTSLRSMLVSLTAPVGAGAKAMEDYGINVRDASGQFIGLEGAAGELQKRLGGLGQAERDAALARIFGKNSLTAATVLYAGGAEGVRKWTDAVNDSGFAARVADTKMDNLAGDVEKLGGAFQSAFIKSAQSTTGPLRSLTQGITGVVDAYSELGEGGQATLFIGSGLAAAALVGVGGVLKLAQVANDAKTALSGLGISAKTAGIAAGAIGLGITAAAAVVGHFAIKQAEAKARTDDLTQSLIASKGAIDSNISSTRAKSLEDSGALKAAQDLGLSIADVTQASLGNADAQARVNAVTSSYASANENVARGLGDVTGKQVALGKAARLVEEAVGGGNKELIAAQEAYNRQSTAAAAAGAATGEVGAAATASLGQLLAVGSAIQDVGTKSTISAAGIKGITDALYGSADAAIAAANAQIGYERALDNANAAKGGGLDVGKESGRKNLELLAAQASGFQKVAEGMIVAGDSAGKVERATRAARKEFVDNAVAMGASSAKANDLADQYGLIPKDVRTKIEAQVQADQQQKLANLESAIAALPDEQETEIRALVDAGDFAGALAKIAELTKPLTTPVGVAVDVNAVRASKGELDYFGQPIKAPVNVKTNGVPKAKGELTGAAKPRTAPLNAKTGGVGKAKGELTGAAKPRRAPITAQGIGIGSVNAQLNNAARSRTASIRVTTTKVTLNQGEAKNADGGVVRLNTGGIPGYRGGHIVAGRGGPRQDNIIGLDAATGLQTSLVSVGEMVTNARSTAANLATLDTINRGKGKRYAAVPLADGGRPVARPVGAGTVAQATTTAHRPIVINIDLGPELGGIRRIVADEIDAAGEYSATLSRMGG